MWPPVSFNAFLQSIMPAPVRSRSSFTDAAVISAISLILSIGSPPAGGRGWGRECARSTGPPLDPLPHAGGERGLGFGQRGFGRRLAPRADVLAAPGGTALLAGGGRPRDPIGRASCRERVCQTV